MNVAKGAVPSLTGGPLVLCEEPAMIAAGPSNCKEWPTSWKIFVIGMKFLRAETLARLSPFIDKIEKLAIFYADYWRVVAQGDVFMREEQPEKGYRMALAEDQEIKGAGGSGLKDFDFAKPWDYTFKAVANGDEFGYREVDLKGVLHITDLKGSDVIFIDDFPNIDTEGRVQGLPCDRPAPCSECRRTPAQVTCDQDGCHAWLCAAPSECHFRHLSRYHPPRRPPPPLPTRTGTESAFAPGNSRRRHERFLDLQQGPVALTCSTRSSEHSVRCYFGDCTEHYERQCDSCPFLFCAQHLQFVPEQGRWLCGYCITLFGDSDSDTLAQES